MSGKKFTMYNMVKCFQIGTFSNLNIEIEAVKEVVQAKQVEIGVKIHHITNFNPHTITKKMGNCWNS